eukprot:SAG11_NODE_19800_length_458_cov_2.000000_1_plen_116_part_01
MIAYTAEQFRPLGLRSKVPQSYVKYYSTDNIKYGKYHKRFKNTTDLKIVGFYLVAVRRCCTCFFLARARAKSQHRGVLARADGRGRGGHTVPARHHTRVSLDAHYLCNSSVSVTLS